MSPPRPLSSDHPTSPSAFQALEEALAVSSAPAPDDLAPEPSPLHERMALLGVDVEQMEADARTWIQSARIAVAARALRELGPWPRPRQLAPPRFILVEGGE
jgi:hypothetical protein